MCAICNRTVRLLMRDLGISRADATGYLWETTPFPFEDPKRVLVLVRRRLRHRASRRGAGEGTNP